MRGLRWIGPFLFVVGIAALVVGFIQGEATLNLFVIFPVITATGAWSALGILLLIAGFFAFFLTWSSAAAEVAFVPETRAEPPASAASTTMTSPARRWGGVVFLGPIPIVFGSDPRMAKWMIVAGFVLLAALVVLTIIALRVI